MTMHPTDGPAANHGTTVADAGARGSAGNPNANPIPLPLLPRRTLIERLRWAFAGRADRRPYRGIVPDGEHTHRSLALVSAITTRLALIDSWAIDIGASRRIRLRELGAIITEAPSAPALHGPAPTPVDARGSARDRVDAANAIRDAEQAAAATARHSAAQTAARRERARLLEELEVIADAAAQAQQAWIEHYAWVAGHYARGRHERWMGDEEGRAARTPAWPGPRAIAGAHEDDAADAGQGAEADELTASADPADEVRR